MKSERPKVWVVVYVGMLLTSSTVSAWEVDSIITPAAWPSVSDAWRGKEFHAVNLLYLFSRIRGVSVDRPSVESLVGSNTATINMEQLRVWTEVLDIPTSVCACKPEELAKLPMPAIVHLEARGDTEATGAFHLLLSIDEEKRLCLLLDAENALFYSKQMDDLVRRWSGYVLIAESAPADHSARSVISIVLPTSVLMTLICWYIWRRDPLRESSTANKSTLTGSDIAVSSVQNVGVTQERQGDTNK